MRWIFCEPGSADAQRQATLTAQIPLWWKAFAANAPEIAKVFSGQSKLDLAEWMHSTLNHLHPYLMWEYGPAVKTTGHRLVITPESHHELRPLVTSILKQAPAIPGWEFYAYRLPEDLEQAQAAVEGRTGGTLQGITFRPAIGPGKRIDLTYYSPRAKQTDDEAALNEVFVGTETLLGEEFLDKWVGSISVEPLPKPGLLGSLFGSKKTAPNNLLPLERLRDTTQALSQSIVEQLPPEPYSARHEGDGWSTYQIEPTEAEDYLLREDVMVGSIMEPELLTAMAQGQGFHSSRFSRVKERFCYIKIDCMDVPIEDRLELRGELEDAIHDALLATKSGGHIGGAVGLRYVYIDLALTNVQTGLGTVRQALKGRVSKRSWVLFCDGDLVGEWLGIYPDSPPPPLPNFDE